MRLPRLVVLLTAAALLSGCWTLSLEPFYTDADVVSDPRLEGTWGGAGDADSEIWAFVAKDDGSYELEVRSESGDVGRFDAHLLRLNGTLYLDIFPEDPEAGSEAYFAHLIPAHSLWRVGFPGDSLSLDILDADWLKEAVATNQIEIAHVHRDDLFILTGATTELQQLIRNHADKAFAGDALTMPRSR